MLPFNRKNVVRSFASEAEANRTFNTYMAITAAFGLVVIVAGILTVAGNIPLLTGALTTIVAGLIAHRAGGIQHDAWLRITPAHVVIEEGWTPLNLDGSPR